MTPSEMWPLIKKKYRLKKSDKKEFIAACKQCKQQHGRWPEYASLEKVKGLDRNIKFLVCVGQSKAIFYNAINPKSRKGKHDYIHPTKNQILLTDASGKVLIYHGETKVKEDGWLHD